VAWSERLSTRAFILLFPTVILMALAAPSVSFAEQELDQAQAESRLDQVTLEIGKLKEQLEESRADHRSEQAGLREIDLDIQLENREFRALEKLRLDHLKELESLERQRKEYLSSLDQRRDQLAVQLRSSYRIGKQSRVQLVLNQDDPVRLGRMLAYYDYMNRAQLEEISGLKESLAVLGRMQQSIDLELNRIRGVQSKQQTVLDQLGQQRAEREVLLELLSGQIVGEESRLQELERNQRDLEALLERLTSALADIPADLGRKAGISGQRGRLPMPVKGPVRHAFGQARTGGLRWQGWLIGAETGAEVSAVGYGRVAFADWLRGYGLLIIIDHGQGYLSLYGHNESMLHEAGAWVEPGEIIGVVGSNPGSGQGLYFELRKNGKAVDPANWLSR